MIVLAAAACERVPLLAPTESTIFVSADTATLAPGGRTQITATVAEQGGTPVQNGTLVRFSATLGRVEPAEVETRGGMATTTFVAGTASGVAQVRAASGAASGGDGDAATNVVEIRIGGAAAGSIVVSANPAQLGAAGGSTTITAALLDSAGNRLNGVPVTFSTTAGTLSASSATTDANGEARVSLTTNSAAKVTAQVGTGSGTAVISQTIDIAVSAAGTVSLTTSPADPVVGSAVQLTVTPATNTAPHVIITWGDGSTDDLGIVTAARATTHVYQAAGTYTITAISGDNDAAFRTSTTVTVRARPAVSVNLAANPTTATRCTPIVFTATTSGDTNASFSSFRWTIDSNESSEDATVTTSGNQLTRVFWQTGRKTVSVTAATTDGRSGDAQTQVVITETTPPSNGDNCR